MKVHSLFRNWQDVCEYRAGEPIYSENDPADTLYFVLSGEVELKLHGETLGVEGAGSMIGETAMLGSGPRSGAATARSDARLARVDTGQLRNLMDKNPDFALQVMAGLANRLRVVDEYIGTHIDRKS